MDEEHLRRLAVTRLTPSRVGVGDRVILLTAASGPSGSGRVDEDDVDVDRKFGTVEQVFCNGRLAAVRCRTTARKVYPISYTESTVVVPLSCCFDLDSRACREEFLCHCLERYHGLKRVLCSKLGDRDEIFLEISRHLVDHSQSLVVFSGYRQKTFDNVFCRHFSARRNYWLQSSKMPRSRIDAAVMLPSAGVVVFAGGVDDHPSVGSPLKTVVSYDTLTGEWSKLPSLNIRRHGCCGAACSGKLFVFGGAYAEAASARSARSEDGEDERDALPFFEHLDLASATERAPPQSSAGGCWTPGTREHRGMETTDRLFASCGVVGGKIILAGGEIPRASSSVRNRYTFEYRVHTVFEVVRDCEIFDPATMEFVPAPSMGDARVGAAFCVWGGKLVVAGGQDEHKQSLRTVEAFDGEKWTRLPDLNQSRFHASMAVWNGVLTIVGGSYEENQHSFSPGKLPQVLFTDKVEQFSEEQNKWVVCHNLRMPLAFHACVAASLSMADL